MVCYFLLSLFVYPPTLHVLFGRKLFCIFLLYPLRQIHNDHCSIAHLRGAIQKVRQLQMAPNSLPSWNRNDRPLSPQWSALYAIIVLSMYINVQRYLIDGVPFNTSEQVTVWADSNDGAPTVRDMLRRPGCGFILWAITWSDQYVHFSGELTAMVWRCLFHGSRCLFHGSRGLLHSRIHKIPKAMHGNAAIVRD